jgi:hypothetical protein
MATTFMARNYSSTSLPTQVSTNIDNQLTTTNIPVQSTAGFPPVPFTGCFERNTPNQEFVLTTGVPDGNHFTVVRGYDGTPPSQHLAPATFEHCVGAIDYREANQHHTNPALDDHIQYLRTDGSRPSTGLQAFPSGISTNILTVAGDTPGSYVSGRYVGGTAGPGPPGGGVYLVGDWVLDTVNCRWQCVVAGSPGTWIPEPGHVFARLFGPAAGVDIVNTTITALSYAFTAIKGVQYVVDCRIQAYTVTALPVWTNAVLTSSLFTAVNPVVYSIANSALYLGSTFSGSCSAALNVPASNVATSVNVVCASAGAGTATRMLGNNIELILRRG